MKITYTEVKKARPFGDGKRYEVKSNDKIIGYVENEKYGWANNWHAYDANGKHLGMAGYTRKDAAQKLISE